MVKLLLIVLYFKIVNVQLIVPKEKDDLRQCVHSLIGNISIGYSTVLFYSDNSYDYVFYNSTEISIINIDARRNVYNLENYRMGKEVIVISISKTWELSKFLTKMYNIGLWSSASTRIRRFIIILPFKEQRQLRRMFYQNLWENNMVDVVCLYYDENNIKLYTSDPEHPDNECGDDAKFITRYGCNFIEQIQFPKLWRNYKNCKLTYWNRDIVQRLEHLSLIYFKAFFVLETARQHLNFTIVENSQTNITEKPRFLIFVGHISVCSNTSYECSLPVLNNGLIWLVPTSNIIEALEAFKLIFKQIVWILILLSFLFTSIVWWYASKCKHHTSFIASLLDIYSATLFGSINTIPPFVLLRLIFAIYVFYAIHIQTLVTSNFIRLLTVPQYDHGITSLEELSQSQLPILTHKKLAFVFQQKDKDDIMYNKLKNKVVMVEESYILDAVLNKEILRNSSILISKVDLDIIIKIKEVKLNYIEDEKFLQYVTMSSLINMSHSQPKRVRPSDPNFEEVVLEWFNAESEGDDPADSDADAICSEHSSDSEVSSLSSQDETFRERRLLRNTLFPRLWESHMVDVVCLYHDENKIKLYTSDPEHPANDCGWEAAYMMEYECNQAKKIQFPKLWRNYKNCELNYWNRNGVQRLEKLNEAYFKAYFVLETARQHLNFTLVEYIRHNITERLKFLIFINHISVCSDISHECNLPFLNTGLIWIVPAATIIHALEVFKIIFKQIVWILILVSFLFMSIVWWFVSKCKHHRSFVASLLDIYSATLLGCINSIPPFLPLRLIFATYVFYAIHIQTLFTSNLIRLLTVPQPDHSITSIEELSESQLPILTHKKMYIVFKDKEENDSIYNKLKNKLIVVNESYILDCIHNTEILRNSSILISKVDLDIIIIKNQIKLHYITDVNFLQHITMSSLVSNPGSYLFVPIKKILSILLESGILDYEQRNYENRMKNYSFYYNDYAIGEEKKVLEMEHVYPIFVYWGIGLIISIVVFILEILIYKITLKSRKN
ncbi:hypothetical protein FQA39_LY01938 [Lamprigera yunnana]|nr:hypothetical protein FQA39_LY01938 [Lamprigera yunnana]